VVRELIIIFEIVARVFDLQSNVLCDTKSSMTNLDKALADITEIRSQIARGAVFRGYGPATIAATGVFAMIAAGVQTLWLPDPSRDVLAYLLLWSATAAVSVALVGSEMVARTQRIHGGLADEMIRAASGQFIPAGIAGGLLSFVLYRYAPQSLWMLPGLWQIFFSLGLFAACRSLPRPMVLAAGWYLMAGLTNLALDADTNALSPWAMAVPFGLGQLLMAAVVHHGSGGDHDNDA
jgi:hypothetical protein